MARSAGQAWRGTSWSFPASFTSIWLEGPRCFRKHARHAANGGARSPAGHLDRLLAAQTLRHWVPDGGKTCPARWSIWTFTEGAAPEDPIAAQGPAGNGWRSLACRARIGMRQAERPHSPPCLRGRRRLFQRPLQLTMWSEVSWTPTHFAARGGGGCFDPASRYKLERHNPVGLGGSRDWAGSYITGVPAQSGVEPLRQEVGVWIGWHERRHKAHPRHHVGPAHRIAGRRRRESPGSSCTSRIIS